MDLFDRINGTRFLGGEFLLWLWYEAVRTDGRFRVGSEDVELYFDDQLVLEANLGEAEQSRLKGGAPAYSPEAHKALQFGKRVTKAKMRLVKDEREWVFQVDGASFRLSGIRVPSALGENDDERFFERMALIEELDSAWYGLYRGFLERRLGSEWETVRGSMIAWIESPTAGDPGA